MKIHYAVHINEMESVALPDFLLLLEVHTLFAFVFVFFLLQICACLHELLCKPGTFILSQKHRWLMECVFGSCTLYAYLYAIHTSNTQHVHTHTPIVDPTNQTVLLSGCGSLLRHLCRAGLMLCLCWKLLLAGALCFWRACPSPGAQIEAY